MGGLAIGASVYGGALLSLSVMLLIAGTVAIYALLAPRRRLEASR